MSHGTLDQTAHDVAKRASAEAAKRGLRIVGMTSRRYGQHRAFTFDYEPIRKARAKSDSQIATDLPTDRIRRGGVRGQGELL